MVTKKIGKWAITAALAAMASGCALVVGLDEDYELVDGQGAPPAGSSGSEGTMSSGSSGTGAAGGGTPTKSLPSCVALPPICGPHLNEDCCASLTVPAGTYNRNNNSAFPASVSEFRLDRFEVTVGRFRAFVDAYPTSKPAMNAGAHPKNPNSGWDAASWDALLPVDADALKMKLKDCGSADPKNKDDQAYANPTWTDTPLASSENLPMNCISWHEAFAFCAWDGGRLPTEAEWNYAAAGGDEQRLYPWGDAEPDLAHATYDCLGDGSGPQICSFGDILRVGSKQPLGDARWGHADMGGSLWENQLDWFVKDSYVMPCSDCAKLVLDQQERNSRTVGGGSWAYEGSYMKTSYRGDVPPQDRNDRDGVRCAREP